MHSQNFADQELALWAKGEAHRAPAFEGGGRLRQARRLDERRGHRRHAQRRGLALARGKSVAVRFIASAMASSTELTTNSPLRWILRVVSLGRAVFVVLQTEDEQGRILGEHVEEGEGARR